MEGVVFMSKRFNDHDITESDTQLINLYQRYINDYSGNASDFGDNREFKCYVEEYHNSTGNLCARLRDKVSNKHVVLWTSPRDREGYVDKQGLLKFLSDVKLSGRPGYYEKNGSDFILVQGLFLDEFDTTIILAAYFAELFLGSQKPVPFNVLTDH